MKSSNFVVLLLLLIVVGSSAQGWLGLEAGPQSPNMSGPVESRYFCSFNLEAGMSNSYVTRGITYLGITAILVFLLILIHYKT
ncbi:hypothetical protein AKJ45_01305 [candidate division MSBL1 archaeon SCGC-AAA261F19]|uniref:Uncharacterized protein n=1 Tax=candidate division MSBL1 archaeon SCGC-AAA261F19 TaxID=1698275 RepID=A0A133VAN8_9EURY|nr:hypothetical protein AKJ45_01305 [candidate division MSBL1 archaeon SCGC-AAA261F19]